MGEEARVLLIGGTSHAGKSTLARSLARRLGWACRSTDSLARHPGRPWRAQADQVPAHVVEHYSRLGVDELMEAVLVHYETMWPTLIEPLLTRHADDRSASGLILEGSALLPSKAVGLMGPRVAAVWITAPEGLLRDRILAESGYAGMGPADRTLADKFLARTLAFNSFVEGEVVRLQLPRVDLGVGIPEPALQERCLATAGLAAAGTTG